MAKKNAAKKDADADKEPVKKDVDETTEDAEEEDVGEGKFPASPFELEVEKCCVSCDGTS